MLLYLCLLLTNLQATIFWASACIGTTLFCLRMLMMFVGGMVEGVDADHGDCADGDEHHDSNASFKILTLHSLSGFLMLFGWIGLACREQWHLSTHYSWAIAFACGFAMMLITAFIFHTARRFEGSGSVFDIQSTVGLVGSVYQRIPANGKGKIQIAWQGVTRELLAQSADKSSVESFVLVKVVAVVDHETVEVIQIK